MVKKLSILIIILIAISIFAGCSHNSPKDAPPSPGEKKKDLAPTFVPESQTPEQYLSKYYDLYTQEKFNETYKMLPSLSKKQRSLQDYKAAHKGLPAESYELGKKTEKGANTVIEVKVNLKGYGPWTVTWQFEKEGKRYIVSDYSATGSAKKKE